MPSPVVRHGPDTITYRWQDCARQFPRLSRHWVDVVYVTRIMCQPQYAVRRLPHRGDVVKRLAFCRRMGKTLGGTMEHIQHPVLPISPHCIALGMIAHSRHLITSQRRVACLERGDLSACHAIEARLGGHPHKALAVKGHADNKAIRQAITQTEGVAQRLWKGPQGRLRPKDASRQQQELEPFDVLL